MDEHRSLPPGTVRLVDIEHQLNTKHADGADRDIVLHPKPSEDPDDPLYVIPQLTKCNVLIGIFCQELDFQKEDASDKLRPDVHTDDRYPFRLSVFSCKAYRESNRSRAERFEHWNRGYVLGTHPGNKRITDPPANNLHLTGVWLGLCYMATSRASVWKATSLLVLHDRFDRYHGRCAALHDERYIPDEQSTAGLLWCASRGAL